MDYFKIKKDCPICQGSLDRDQIFPNFSCNLTCFLLHFYMDCIVLMSFYLLILGSLSLSSCMWVCVCIVDLAIVNSKTIDHATHANAITPPFTTSSNPTLNTGSHLSSHNSPLKRLCQTVVSDTTFVDIASTTRQNTVR